MKNLLLILLSFFGLTAKAQSTVEVDSLTYQLCHYLETINHIDNDSLKLDQLYEVKLFPYLRRYPESKYEEVGNQIYYRLQRNCVEFRALLDRMDPSREEVNRSTSHPKSNLSKAELEEFKKQSKFSYFEINGEVTHVQVKKNQWKDIFHNNTESNLTYEWINDTDFELTYVNSNNEIRSKYSVKGDKYIYSVIDKQNDYYVLYVNIPGQSVYEEIKLFVVK